MTTISYNELRLIENNNLFLEIVAEGNLKRMEKILKSPDLDINCRTKAGWSALMIAVHNRYQKMIEVLLKAGINRELENWKGQTALDIATKRNYHEIIELLSKKEEVIKKKKND